MLFNMDSNVSESAANFGRFSVGLIGLGVVGRCVLAPETCVGVDLLTSTQWSRWAVGGTWITQRWLTTASGLTRMEHPQASMSLRLHESLKVALFLLRPRRRLSGDCSHAGGDDDDDDGFFLEMELGDRKSGEKTPVNSIKGCIQ